MTLIPWVICPWASLMCPIRKHSTWLAVTICWHYLFNFELSIIVFLTVLPPRSTQPGHPFVCRHNEYQPKGGDALRLGSKGMYSLCEGVWQVLCDPLVTHESYLITLEVQRDKVLYKFMLRYFTLVSTHSPVTYLNLFSFSNRSVWTMTSL